MKRRIPLLVAAALGIFLWRGGLGIVPIERTITWRLWGDYASIRSVTLTLKNGDEVLYASTRKYPDGVTFEPSSELSLSSGEYAWQVELERAGGAVERRAEKLRVDWASPALTVP